MEEFFRATSSDIGPSQETLSIWQRIDYQTNGEEQLYFDIVGRIRYPDNESELNAAFSLKAGDNLAHNGC